MGGSGSGRWHWHRKKTAVEQCLVLSVFEMCREGAVKPWTFTCGTWLWISSENNVHYQVSPAGKSSVLVLRYRINSSDENLDLRIPLVTTRPNFGSVRFWFICPLNVGGRGCHRRVAKLYLPPGGKYFGCRHCYDLSYTSAQEAHKFDDLWAMIAERAGVGITVLRNWSLRT